MWDRRARGCPVEGATPARRSRRQPHGRLSPSSKSCQRHSACWSICRYIPARSPNVGAVCQFLRNSSNVIACTIRHLQFVYCNNPNPRLMASRMSWGSEKPGRSMLSRDNGFITTSPSRVTTNEKPRLPGGIMPRASASGCPGRPIVASTMPILPSGVNHPTYARPLATPTARAACAVADSIAPAPVWAGGAGVGVGVPGLPTDLAIPRASALSQAPCHTESCRRSRPSHCP